MNFKKGQKVALMYHCPDKKTGKIPRMGIILNGKYIKKKHHFSDRKDKICKWYQVSALISSKFEPDKRFETYLYPETCIDDIHKKIDFLETFPKPNESDNIEMSSYHSLREYMYLLREFALDK